MTPLLTHDAASTVLTAAQERALAAALRAGRRARLLAQRHLAARLRRELPPTLSARAAAAAVLAALRPRLPLAPAALPAALSPLLPRALAAGRRTGCTGAGRVNTDRASARRAGPGPRARPAHHPAPSRP